MNDSQFELGPVSPFSDYASLLHPDAPKLFSVDATPVAVDDPMAQLAWKLMVSEGVNACLNERLDEMTHAALTDEMTGLYRKNTFHEKTNELIAEGKTVVVMLLDLTNFKLLNDSEGHEAGDQRLQDIAKILEYVCTVSDWFGRIGVPVESVISRLGGDEFGLAFAVEGMELDEVHIRYLEEECTPTPANIQEMYDEGIDQEQINYFIEYGFDPEMLAKIKRGLKPEEVAGVVYEIIQDIFHNHYLPSSESETPDQGISIGINVHNPALDRSDDVSSEFLLRNADTDMYVDKARQRKTLGLGMHDRRSTDQRRDTKTNRRSIFGRRWSDRLKISRR